MREYRLCHPRHREEGEVAMPKLKKRRHKLGEGNIWFSDRQADGYHALRLLNGDGGISKSIKVGKLGGWQRVKLYAEYYESK